MIILTSFKNMDKYEGTRYAITFPPKDLQIPSATALFPGAGGVMVHSKDYDDPEKYRESLMGIYRKKKEKIIKFLASLDFSTNIILCCHCNSESKAETIKQKGFMLCHSGIVGQIIHKLYPTPQIELDEDRRKYLPLQLHPSYDPVKCSKCCLGGIEKCGEFREYCYGPYMIGEDGGIYSMRPDNFYLKQNKKEEAHERKFDSYKAFLCHSGTGNNRCIQRQREDKTRSDSIFQICRV